jgi:hypothetical protein
MLNTARLSRKSRARMYRYATGALLPSECHAFLAFGYRLRCYTRLTFNYQACLWQIN